MILESANVLADHRGGDGEFLFPFFLVLLLGLAAFLFFRRRRGGPVGRGASARQVLDERFARGDIDRAEYEHRKAVLDGKDDVPPAPPRTSTAVADPPDDPPADPAGGGRT
ncbi:MAG: SHOCT domain-containing protein [Actinomycetota bacterium]